MASRKTKNTKLRVGRTEWASLPELGINKIKAKIDTGAWTSALHAFDIEPYNTRWGLFVRFKTVPLARNSIVCRARVIDEREVTSSVGTAELRYVIETEVVFGDKSLPIEVTLSNRSNMKYRMLLGRAAMKGKIIVDPNKNELLGLPER